MSLRFSLMVPSSICADGPLPYGVWLRRVGARQPGKGCDGGGCEGSRVRADYTIWRV